MESDNHQNKGTLYLIPTPIGNMKDMTERSLETLAMVDVLFCEDTRVTEGLLVHFHLPYKKLISCHDHNEEHMKSTALKYLENGFHIGLVTDRGTPIISDPGYKIVEEVIQHGYSVVSLPGATALIPALTMSGLSPSPFLFYGFLSSKKSQRELELKRLQPLPYTLIFYEAPHRILEMLQAVHDILGNRTIALCREISKLYEEVIRGNVESVLQKIQNGVRGELVVVVDGNHEQVDYSQLSILEHVHLYLEDGMSEKDAIKLVAKERNVPKSVIYKEYHTRK